MQDVHNILPYCNTDVVIIKPVTGRARICSASLKTTEMLIALGLSTLCCTMSYCNTATYFIYCDSSTG